MKKLILISAIINLIVSFSVFADNQSLDIEIYQFKNYRESECYSEMSMWACGFETYKSCDFIVSFIHKLWKDEDTYEALFPDGEVLGCINNELPEAWVESRISIKSFGLTVCEIGCNVRYFPIITSPVEPIGRIQGSKEIFILEAIEITNNLNPNRYPSPWYNHWYTFMYDGKKLYIHKDNVNLED